jgi:hypothetical protein
MKSRFFAIHCGVVVSIAMLAGSSLAVGQDLLIPPASYAVQGAPFTAMLDSEWEGTAKTSAGRSLSRVVRDIAGRERFEQPAVEEGAAIGQPSQVTIYDVVGEKLIRLNTQSKTATVVPMTRLGRPMTIDPSARPLVSRKTSPGGTYLGVRWITGLEAWGEHLVQTYPKANGQSSTTVRDLWLSTVYKMPLMEVRQDALLGKVTQQVTRFDPGEPEATLFEVPPGYVVVPPQGTPRGSMRGSLQ